MRVVDDESEETPPKTAPPVKPKVGDPGYRSGADRKLEASITTVYEGLGMGTTAIGLQIGDNGIFGTGVKITENASMVAAAWMDVAEQNKRVKDALIKFTEASRVGTLIGCHMAMMLPLLADRGIIPNPMAEHMNGTDPRDRSNHHGT